MMPSGRLLACLCGLAALAATAGPAPARAHSEVNAFLQPERRDETGRVTVEAAAVHVIHCDDEGENGGEYYVYQYIYRDGFRVIAPPNWGQVIGGRDWDTYMEAVTAACTSQVPDTDGAGPAPGTGIEPGTGLTPGGAAGA